MEKEAKAAAAKARALAAAERAKNAKRVLLVQQQESNEEEERKRKEHLEAIERQLQEAMQITYDTNRRIIELDEQQKIKQKEEYKYERKESVKEVTLNQLMGMEKSGPSSEELEKMRKAELEK
jgi:hypothetical protein